VSDAPRVLLITGPGGSGKSTLAARLAERSGWVHLSEDECWIDKGWGSGLRSPEHERVVQQQVAIDLLTATRAGRSVALEFILYKPPPNPLTAYQDVLAEHGITYRTIALKPPVEEVVRRLMRRGRPQDLNELERRRIDAAHQVRIVESDDVDPAWVLDPTGMTLDDLCGECFSRFATAG
jgi:adenylate kinase